MNIIHVTNLTNNKASGISAIVPHHIKWQAQYANVFWLNLNSEYNPSNELRQIYCSIKEYPDCEIRSLPSPFNTPDLVVFHGVYFYKYIKLARQLNKIRVPYIVVPHGSLTKSAIKQKRLKKQISFFFLFGKFLKEARSIQYLTKGEREASGDSWNNDCIIIPNGCEIPLKQRRERDQGGAKNISFVYIGRKDIYHKGIDFLLEACSIAADTMRKNGAILTLYGPDRKGSFAKIDKMISKYKINDFVFNKDGIFDHEKEDVLKKSSVFVLTSRFEGQPIALLEACAYGLPVLVTPGTNVSDEVERFNCGWVANLSGESIAERITYIINHHEEIEKCSKNAYEYVAEMYGWEKVASGAIEKYREVVTNRQK